MAKAKAGWRRNNGFGEDRVENNKKIDILEIEGITRLKELFETSPDSDASALRKLEGFVVELDGHELDLGISGFNRVVGVRFRYPYDGWSSSKVCTGLGVSGRVRSSGQSFGRHYGYDFEANRVSPTTFKKMAKGIREYLEGIVTDKRRTEARARVDQDTLDRCQGALVKAGYEVVRRGIVLEVEFREEFKVQFSAPKRPGNLIFKAMGNGYLSLGWGTPGKVRLCGHFFSVKPATIVQVMVAIENFYDMMGTLDAIEG